MYARLEDEEDMDQYTISGNEEIIFLMTNSSQKSAPDGFWWMEEPAHG